MLFVVAHPIEKRGLLYCSMLQNKAGACMVIFIQIRPRDVQKLTPPPVWMSQDIVHNVIN
jgi:hypothetical protein